MTIIDLFKLYKPERRVLSILTEDDLEYILHKKFRLNKNDISHKEWDDLMARCSQRLLANTTYEKVFKALQEDIVEAVVPALLKKGLAIENDPLFNWMIMKIPHQPESKHLIDNDQNRN